MTTKRFVILTEYTVHFALNASEGYFDNEEEAWDRISDSTFMYVDDSESGRFCKDELNRINNLVKIAPKYYAIIGRDDPYDPNDFSVIIEEGKFESKDDMSQRLDELKETNPNIDHKYIEGRGGEKYDISKLRIIKKNVNFAIFSRFLNEKEWDLFEEIGKFDSRSKAEYRAKQCRANDRNQEFRVVADTDNTLTFRPYYLEKIKSLPIQFNFKRENCANVPFDMI